MRHLNEVKVARTVILIQEGWTFHHVAVDLNVSPSVIHRLWHRYNETGENWTFKRWNGQQCVPTLIPLTMCGIGLTEVFVGILFHHRLSKTLNRLLLKNRT